MPRVAPAWRLLSTTLLALGLLAGCERRGDVRAPRPEPPRGFGGDVLPPLAAQGEPRADGELRVAMDAEPPSLNCQLDPLDIWSKKVDELVYESLARPNPLTFADEPRLAERWDISPDELTLTFHLRKGVRWHDGRPFSADDVIFTFDKILDPTSKTLAIRSSLEPLASYTKVDPWTVRFVLKRSYWFAVDAIAEILIYPKHIYSRGDFNTHPANRAPIGTGRFKFLRWQTGDEVVLLRNEDYFGPRARLAQITFKYVPDPTVRVQMLRRGDLDVLERVSPEAWSDAAGDAALAVRFWRLRHTPTGLQWIGWNEERPYFRDARVRRALTMLIDREDIVHNLRRGLDELATSWFYPLSTEYNRTIKPWPYDPKKALSLLEDAGWSDSDGDGVLDNGEQRFVFTFLYPSGNAFYEQLASLLQSDLGRVGIVVETARLEWAVFSERLRRHEFDACSLLWHLYPRHDPYQVWHSTSIAGGSNFISFRGGEVDTLLEQARTEFDDNKRNALYQRFSQILHDEQPYTLLFNRNNLSLVAKGLGGIYTTPYGIFRYEDFYWRKDANAASTADSPASARPSVAQPHAPTPK